MPSITALPIAGKVVGTLRAVETITFHCGRSMWLTLSPGSELLMEKACKAGDMLLRGY